MFFFKCYFFILDYRYSLCSWVEGNVNSKVRCFGWFVWEMGMFWKNLLVVYMYYSILIFSLFLELLVYCIVNKFGCIMYWYNNMLFIFRIFIIIDKENNEY